MFLVTACLRSMILAANFFFTSIFKLVLAQSEFRLTDYSNDDASSMVTDENFESARRSTNPSGTSSSQMEQPQIEELSVDELSVDEFLIDELSNDASIDGESTVEHELTLPRVDEFDSAEDLELRNVYIRSSLLYTWYLMISKIHT